MIAYFVTGIQNHGIDNAFGQVPASQRDLPLSKVQNRRAMLTEVKNDKDTYTSAKAEKLDVHMYGSSVEIVVGMANEKGTRKDGKVFDRIYRFTDTWIDRGGNWQCVASQVSLVGQR